MHIEVPNMTQHILPGAKAVASETSADVSKRIHQAYDRQLQRVGKANNLMANPEIERFCALSKEQYQILESIDTKYNLSARALHRILKVSRTIADLEHSSDIPTPHLHEAIGYRRLDRLQTLQN